MLDVPPGSCGGAPSIELRRLLESPLPYPLPTPASWGEGIDQRHGDGADAPPSTQVVNSAVDTPSTFVRLAARFDGIHRRNLTETATLLIYGQDQEVRLSVWKQEG